MSEEICATLSPGTQLGPYQILGLIGAGGMGEVYRAHDTRLRRDVAIKLLTPEFSKDADRLRRFEQEAWATGMLNHPNLLSVHDFGSHEGSPYVVVELLEGQTLRDRLAEGPKLSTRRAVDYALQMAFGLATAHQKGVVHRDLKPENIFITRDNRVKILDFGLAKVTESHLGVPAGESTVAFRTEPGFILGTVGYMAPEQVRGLPADHRSDIFALGAILYEMVMGQRAFNGDSTIETLNAILKEEPPETTASGKVIPPAVDRIIRHCLEKRPEDRFQSARDLAFALEAVITGASDSSVRSLPRGLRAWWRQRMPWLAAVAAALALGFLLAFWLVGRRPAEPPTFRYLTYSGRDHSPAASPDGRFVAFTSERNGTARIWLKDLAAGDERPLTAGPDDSPRFSPLGSMIVFVRSEGSRSALYRIGVLGGDPRMLVEDAVEGDWSPDGKRIAFLRWKTEGGRVSSAIGLIEPNGSNERQIALHDQKLSHLRWSPDGQRIAAIELPQSGAPAAIFSVAADGADRRVVATGRPGFSMSAVGWLNGTDVLYFQNESALQGGLGVNLGTANIIRENVLNGAAERIAWSADAATVLDVIDDGRLVYDTCSPRASLREIAIDGNTAGPSSWLTRGSSNDRQPTYSPDGEWIVFSSNRSGNLDLWRMSPKRSIVRRLTEDEAEDWDPVFTADGGSILWSSNRSGHFEIWMADADGSRPRQVSRDGVDAENPSPSPDGHWVVYASGAPDKQGLWKVHPDGRGAARLAAGSLAFPEVSPDGNYVLYASDYVTERLTLRVVELETGAAVPFEIRVGAQSSKLGFALGRAKWMPDSKAIAYIGQNERGVNGVYWQPFAPGRDTSASRRPLLGFDEEYSTESFGVAPDGKRLAVANWERVFSLMIADRLPFTAPPRPASRP